jgi:signal transduction histidine kinase
VTPPERSARLAPLTRAGLWIAYLSPLVGLTLLGLLNRLILVRLWPIATADWLTLALALVLTLIYSHAFLTRIREQYTEVERLLTTTRDQRDRLRLLQEAMTAIAGNRDWQTILERVVELSRELTGARYGALAVLNPDESIARFITSGLSPDEVRRIGSLPRGRGLLGEVIHTRRPVRVDDIAQHPSAVGWPPGHPHMTTFLGMPVLYQDQVMGHLYLTDKAGGPFTADDEELVGLLAAHAAVLISNARLNRQIEELAVVEERQRIGMDLHDGTIQSLYGVTLALDTLLPKIPPDLTEIRRVLDDLGDRLTRIMNDIRHYIFDLRHAPQDWHQAVERIAEELGLAPYARIHASDRAFEELSLRQQETVLAWIREALSNVARHAHAAHVEVTWRGEGDRFRVTVEDDGVGFDPTRARVAGHFGLAHLEQRAAELGGEVVIQSAPQAGTTVALTAPMVPPADLSPDG